MKKRNKIILIFAYYLIYSVIYAGWLLHESIKPVIFRYSLTYFVFLVAMAFFFLLPMVIVFYIRRVGRKGLAYSLIGIFGLLCTVYIAGALYYYYTQRHLFDPFLQNPLYDSKDPKMTEKENGAFRILCMGGSTTANKGLREKDQYPSVLEKILRERYPFKNIEVFNGGRGWYTTKHSLIGYVTYYSDWKPDLVIVMHAINDICRSFSPPDFAIGEYNDLWTHFYGPAINGARPPTFEQHLLSYFEIPLNAWYSRLRFKEIDYPVESYVSINAFERNLRKIIRCVESNNQDIIVVSQPSLYKKNMNKEELSAIYFGKTIANERLNFMQIQYPSGRSFFRTMKFFNEMAKGVASSEGVFFVDAAGRVEKNLQNFRDDLHYTKRGARLLGEAIANAIIEEGLVEYKI